VAAQQEADGLRWWVIERIGPNGTGSSGGLQVGDPETVTAAKILVAIALYLQAQVFDTDPWGEPRPVCPGHPHPADPTVIDGQAVWICPRNGRVVAAMGQLA
jgi:hypothetical protein